MKDFDPIPNIIKIISQTELASYYVQAQNLIITPVDEREIMNRSKQESFGRFVRFCVEHANNELDDNHLIIRLSKLNNVVDSFFETMRIDNKLASVLNILLNPED